MDSTEGSEDDLSIPLRVKDLISSSLRLSDLRQLSISGASCPETRITDSILCAMIKTLIQQNIFLESLSLKFHRITSEGFLEISRYIYCTTTPVLKALDVEGNDITGECMSSLCLQMEDDCPIETLNMSSNPLDLVGGTILAESFLTNNSLKHLFLNNCGFTMTALIAMVTNLASRVSSLGTSPPLESLEIDRPLLWNSSVKQEDCTDHISRLIQLFPKIALRKLSMRFHSMQDLGTRLIADSLTHCESSTLISLNLESNMIGVGGAEAIASFIILQSKMKNYSNCLQILKLSYNKIGDDGAIALASVRFISSLNDKLD